MARDLSQWTPCPVPGEAVLTGYGVRLEPFAADRHIEPLFATLCGPGNESLWDWILHGPFTTQGALRDFFLTRNASGEWRTMVIVDEASGACLGTASYMRLRPDQGSAEIGAVLYGQALQRTRAGTAAFHLMATHLFDDLGYRRFEWKCNAQNAASGRAALRYGFSREGRFRNDYVWRGRNRDTDWYSIIDCEWPGVKAALDAWLDAANFGETGEQHESLSAIRDRLG
ncbi:GNAT family N-acetyltransferase [Aquisalinus flavus]|uniref:Acetyltransferase n=1 Tax=Aquisalinus flavus TaxID=1526572 RepID=A0A8J2V4Y6_9PROT|nr:GNAT family protein [Aquisalinus flavus]MBD0425645.1 GNAT family N-acetyltransferase [Aquisalinus flavus]UNE48739.1 GNAT family N-acetyltransferase [Aquisalinus flavus]GGD14385.1 acetyltransferase [Aquisalinus flavus]